MDHMMPSDEGPTQNNIPVERARSKTAVPNQLHLNVRDVGIKASALAA